MLLACSKSAIAVALALAGVAAAKATQRPLTINTPADVVECEPTLLQWAGGKAPYFLSVYIGTHPEGPFLIESLGKQSGTSITWHTSLAAGTSLSVSVKDSSGNIAESAPFPVNARSDSCTP